VSGASYWRPLTIFLAVVLLVAAIFVVVAEIEVLASILAFS